jgi:hypothetical protein
MAKSPSRTKALKALASGASGSGCETDLSQDPLALIKTKGTPRVHAKRMRANSQKTRRKFWRRGWDSNPRYGFPYARFRGEYFQPLSHLSAAISHRSRRFAFPAMRRCIVRHQREQRAFSPPHSRSQSLRSGSHTLQPTGVGFASRKDAQ